MALGLDLRKAHSPRVHGDIVAVLTWGNDALALVLNPATREDAGWFIVEETASYLWNINTVDCDEHAAAPEHANPHAGKRLTGVSVSTQFARTHRAGKALGQA
nr:hypothetical protein [uncultured Roseateles sp.]